MIKYKPEVLEESSHEPQSIEIVLAGHRIRIYKMTWRSFERLAHLLEPHIKTFMSVRLESDAVKRALKGEKVPEETLQQEMGLLFQKHFGDLVCRIPEVVGKGLLIIMNFDVDDEDSVALLESSSLEELLDTFSMLDDLNNFSGILEKLVSIFGKIARRESEEITED